MKEEQVSMAIYIKTSKENYIINLLVSGLLALVSGFFLYTQLPWEFGRILFALFFALLIFLVAFRVMEYVLTKKSIRPNKVFVVGDIESGENAKIYFYFNLFTLIFFELLIIFYKYFQQ